MPSSAKLIQKKPRWHSRHPILTVFAVLLLVLGLYLAVSSFVLSRQISAERKQFMQAKSDLESVYADIVAQVGQPAQHQALQYCSYTSVEFGRGTRGCDINHHLVYATQEPDLLQSIVKLNRVISANPQVANFQSAQLGANDRPQVKELEVNDFTLKNNIKCYVDYWEFASGQLPYSARVQQSTVKNGLYIDLGCGGAAKAEYFPVATN